MSANLDTLERVANRLGALAVGATTLRVTKNQRFLDAVPGHLPPDEASQGRLGIVLGRMQRFAASA